jgi:hypothetical protein
MQIKRLMQECTAAKAREAKASATDSAYAIKTATKAAAQNAQQTSKAASQAAH